MYLDRYFEKMEEVLAAIRTTQRKQIERAGEAVAEALAHGGALLIMDTGHMLRHEAFVRAGGLIAWTPFSYNLHVENPLDWRSIERTSKESAALEARLVALALDSSKLKRGDILIINSNSGRTTNVVETALQCGKRGITTIAICSSEQMKKCDPVHPSGKKLADVADIFIDNCTPHGDALVEVRDNEKMCPGSGIASVYVLWAIQAEAVERLQARGLNPSIYRSVHLGGYAFIEKQKKKFLKKGF
ncbi:MAG TPA: sugar isomerase domain-containing protein [Candidatus Hydrogenedentes bacterium]|nr:sugar isomerase domain-containing protein [Candidatus Hydrogenedentota bacterium]HOL76859.1 sugar isomerase domain-containing protein [Candidatus Hydrogenedentota bacterium]HPO85510.1 sugar isomerase domain-containing protein [Candidatus Hydrogenedentota bacterium]